MKKIPELKDDDIETLLKKEEINKDENIDMFFQIIKSKLLNKDHSLYLCELKDKKSAYGNFILKSEKNDLNSNKIIHVSKIKITLVNDVKIISCLKYEFCEMNQNKGKEEKDKNEKEKEEIERKIYSEELNEETKLLLGNLKHKKRKKKYFFKYEKGNLNLIDKKTNKIVDLSSKKSSKKKENDEKQILESNNINNNNISEEFLEKLNIEDKTDFEDIKDIKDYDDKEETKKMFEGIDINEILNINEKRNKEKLNLKFQVLINLSTSDDGKDPLYIKCIKKEIIMKEQQKF